MTLTVHIDGWPYRISFCGTIEIAPMWESEHVAIRRMSDDARIGSVELDEETLQKERETIAKVRSECRDWVAFWDQLTMGSAPLN